MRCPAWVLVVVWTLGVLTWGSAVGGRGQRGGNSSLFGVNPRYSATPVGIRVKCTGQQESLLDEDAQNPFPWATQLMRLLQRLLVNTRILTRLLQRLLVNARPVFGPEQARPGEKWIPTKEKLVNEWIAPEQAEVHHGRWHGLCLG